VASQNSAICSYRVSFAEEKVETDESIAGRSRFGGAAHSENECRTTRGRAKISVTLNSTEGEGQRAEIYLRSKEGEREKMRSERLDLCSDLQLTVPPCKVAFLQML